MGNSPTFGAIYAGISGPCLGARWAGLDVQWAIEPRKYFNIKTFRYNFPSVMWSDQPKAFFNVPVDIIWGSPSCGEISSAGRSSKNQIKVIQKEFDEFEYVQFIQEICRRKPKIFILENLPSIRNWLAFEATPGGTVLKHQISHEVIELPNYYIEEHRIQPCEVGVAQIRDRLFTIGSLFPYRFMLKPPLVDDRHRMSIRYIFEDLQARRDAGEVLPNDKIPTHTPEKIEMMARVRPGEGAYGGTNNKRLDANKCSPVIMSSGTKYIHPWENRLLTNRESACLMGYPLDFVAFGSENQVLDMIGKGVIPQVAEFILKQAKEYLENYQG